MHRPSRRVPRERRAGSTAGSGTVEKGAAGRIGIARIEKIERRCAGALDDGARGGGDLGQAHADVLGARRSRAPAPGAERGKRGAGLVGAIEDCP